MKTTPAMLSAALALLLCSLQALPVAAQVLAVQAGIDSDGLYSVGAPELAAAFGVGEAEVVSWLGAGSLAVENLGQPVAAVYATNSLTFFARGYSTRYTGQNVYWITRKTGTAAGFVESAGAAEVAGQSFATSCLIEQNTFAQFDLFSDADSDPWLWRMLLPVMSITRTLRAPFVLPGAVSDGSLVVRLKGAGTSYNDVSVTLSNSLGSAVLGSVTVSGLDYVSWTTPVSALMPTGNTLSITATIPSGESICVDNFTVSYQRAYEAVSNELIFTADQHDVVTVTGFTSSDIAVFDVTAPAAMVEVIGLSISGSAGDYRVSFHPSVSTGRYIAAVGARAATSLTADTPSHLRGANDGVDFVAIAPAALMASANTLVAYRAAHGLSAMAVDLQDIYDEFNHGIADPRAIKAFISHAHRMWERSPRYVVLIGEGSLDYRNYDGSGDCLVPSMVAASSYGLFPSDQLLVDVNPDGVPDVAIGRMPVRNEADFQTMFDKIVAYEAGGGWRDRAVAVADSAEAGLDFPQDSEMVVAQMTGLSVDRLYLDFMPLASVHSNLTEALSAGFGVATYFGQGSVSKLGDSTDVILGTADIAALTNSGMPALVFMMTCLANNFGLPGVDCLGEQLVVATNGAVAVWGSCDLIYGADSFFLCLPMFTDVYANAVPRLGDSMLSSVAHARANGRSDIATAYNLLGDPALAVSDINAPRSGLLTPVDADSYEPWLARAFGPAVVDAGLGLSPSDDPDGDGMSNYDEFIAGTDPMDAGSLLRINSLSRLAGGSVVVRWNSVAHRIYDLDRSTNLVGSSFAIIRSDMPATAAINTCTDTVSSASTFFYRVRAK